MMDVDSEPLVRDTNLNLRKYCITDTFQDDDIHATRDFEKLYETIDSVLAHLLGSDGPSLLSIYSATIFKACRLSKPSFQNCLLQACIPGETIFAEKDIQDYFRLKPPNVRIVDLVNADLPEERYQTPRTIMWGRVPFENCLLAEDKSKPECNDLWLSKDLVDVFLEASRDPNLEVQCKMIIVDTLFRNYAHCLLKNGFTSTWLTQICGVMCLHDKFGEIRREVENLIFGFSLLVDLPFDDAHPPAVRNIAKLIARVNETDDYELDVSGQRKILDSLRLVKIHQAHLTTPFPSAVPGCTRVRGLAYMPWREEGGNQADLPPRQDYVGSLRGRLDSEYVATENGWAWAGPKPERAPY